VQLVLDWLQTSFLAMVVLRSLMAIAMVRSAAATETRR
jgi:hypothetical protein